MCVPIRKTINTNVKWEDCKSTDSTNVLMDVVVPLP